LFALKCDFDDVDGNMNCLKFLPSGAPSGNMRSVLLLTVWAVALPAWAGEAAPTPSAGYTGAKEEVCDDGLDNDADSVIDCGDNDCVGTERCKSLKNGQPENTDERCSDWLDNDGDGIIDCEDQECQQRNINVCQGSWKGDVDGDGEGAKAAGGDGTKDISGIEREGADSETGVGFVGIKFGVVAAVREVFTADNELNQNELAPRLDTRFNNLQLRAFGAMPLLEDSFFLINIEASQSPRLSFAMFQIPLGAGHYFAMNTGGTTLSAQPLLSVAKRPLLDLPRYFLRAFDQFLDAGVEFSGPVILNLLRYRVIAGGGAGINGDIGGRLFEDAAINPTYTVGAQLTLTPVGRYSRQDNPFLFRPVPLGVGISLGGKWEQREQERFPAMHALVGLRWGILETAFESYSKAEVNYGALQMGNYLRVGVLAWPEVLFFSADAGHFYSTAFGELTKITGIQTAGDPSQLPSSLRRQTNVIQTRLAGHWFFWRQNGILSTRYQFDMTDPRLSPQGTPVREVPILSHEVVVQAMFRF
jgi:hypothetical protein